ncbi:MAG: hypothetical protein U0401_02935 [Anaerolineae bacterium]
MKLQKLNGIQKAVLGSLAAVAMWLMLLIGGGSASAVYAAAPLPQEKVNIYLEFMLQRQQLMLTGQQQHLDLARQGITVTQSFLDQLKATGEDVSALQTALDTFTAKVAEAQTAHDTAKQILDAKAGFDANGKVTDLAQARETLKSARQAMQEAHEIIQQAAKEFRQAMRDFRQAHKPNKPGNQEDTGDEETIP